MPKNEYIANVVEQVNKLDWAMPFQRTGSFPLDRSSVFSSLNDAELYATGGEDSRGLSKSSYVGQGISVYDELNQKVDFYVIQPDRSLKQAGSSLLGDNSTIEVIDGTIKLKNFGNSYYSYNEETKQYDKIEGFVAGLQPKTRLLENGNIEIAWYAPSETTVEGVNEIVTSLSETVNVLSTSVENIQNNLKNIYTKDETNTAIATAVSEVSHLQRKVVDSLKDIDVSSEDAEKYIYMVKTGLEADDNKYYEYIVVNNEIEKVGTWEVDLSNYATKDELDNKVDVVDGSSLVSNTLIKKLQDLQEIKTVDNNTFQIVNGNLQFVESGIPIEKVNGLTDTLSDKLDIENLNSELEKLNNFSGFITAEERNKLNTIELNAQVNFIKSVNTEHFTVVDGKLAANNIPIENIKDLNVAITTLNNLNTTVNGNGTESNIGLVATVNAIKQDIETNYISLNDFNTVIGDLTELKKNNNSISQRIDSLENSLLWEEMIEEE